MDVYRGLNKYGFNPNIKQLEKYNLITRHLKTLNTAGINIKIKDEYDLQYALVYYHSLLNKERLAQIYQHLLNDCHGLWEYMDYHQRQVLISGELELILNEIPHFYFQENLILMPFFDFEINQRYIQDYQSLFLKQNKYLLEDFRSEICSPMETYGEICLLYGFSDFQMIARIKELSYFYLEDYKAIYIFNHHTNIFALKIIIVSKDIKKENAPMIELEHIVNLMASNDASGLVDFLFEHLYISKKVYQQLTYKYIGG